MSSDTARMPELKVAPQLEPASRLPGFLKHVVQSNEQMAILANAHAHFFMQFLVELRRRGILCGEPRRPLTDAEREAKVRHLSSALSKTETEVLLVLLEELDVPKCSEQRLVTHAMSLGYIADQCGRWMGSVQRAIEQMMALGIVEAVTFGRGARNEYRLKLPDKLRKRLPQKASSPKAQFARARVLNLHRCVSSSRTGACKPHAPVRDEPHAPAQIARPHTIYCSAAAAGAGEGAEAAGGWTEPLRAAAAADFESLEISRQKAQHLFNATPEVVFASLYIASRRPPRLRAGLAIKCINHPEDEIDEVAMKFSERRIRNINHAASTPAATPSPAMSDRETEQRVTEAIKAMSAEEIADLRNRAIDSGLAINESVRKRILTIDPNQSAALRSIVRGRLTGGINA